MRASGVTLVSMLVTVTAVAAVSSSAGGQGVQGCPAPAQGPATQRLDQDSAARAPTDSARAETGPADIVLVASIEAREVRFNSPPDARVRFCWGTGGGDTLRVIERRNLPSPVAAGVTYRNVYVAVELLGHLNAVCLLRELGLAGARDARRAAPVSGEIEGQVERGCGVSQGTH